ncbi:MAG: glycosyltransferase family 9 protein [Candidatus Hydrogenedentota bacterium]
MRILVVQTTRMGDVIQTTPLISAVRMRYPGAHITVMVRRMGKAVAERHPDVDDILVYDEDQLYLDLAAGDSDRLLHAYEIADERVQQLRAEHFDRAYNVTHSLSSAMLLKLAEIPEVVGAHLTDDWTFVLRADWAPYFFMSVLHREFNDLNLVDITRHFEPEADARQLRFNIHAADRAQVEALLKERGITPDDALCCMQLGASEENKRWFEAHFADLARMLHDKHGLRIVLVGVQEEAPLGDVFEQHAPGLAVKLYGETSIPQLAALLERARILVTNDTGTMHIAAAAGCPVTLVSVGHVHYRETGPYGEGHCAIEWRRADLGSGYRVPTGLEERSLVQPGHVLHAVEATLAFQAPGDIVQINETPDLEEIDLYLTRFAPDGCLAYYPLLRRPLLRRDFVRTAYRFMWLATMDHYYRIADEQASMEALLSCYEGPDAETRTAWADELAANFSALADLAQRGIDATNALLEHLHSQGSMSAARDMVTALMKLDEQMRIHSEMHPACRPLIVVARHERDNLEGADPIVLAETTRTIYDACRNRAQIFTQKAYRLASARA